MVQDEIVVLFADTFADLKGIQSLTFRAKFFAFSWLNASTKLTVEFFSFSALFRIISSLDVGFVTTERSKVVVFVNFVELSLCNALTAL